MAVRRHTKRSLAIPWKLVEQLVPPAASAGTHVPPIFSQRERHQLVLATHALSLGAQNAHNHPFLTRKGS
jgi:hypothetical protein